jgi:protein-arginine deiminase
MSGKRAGLPGAGDDADKGLTAAPLGRVGDFCPPNVPRLNLHVDADRDGRVDPAPAQPSWEYGDGKLGAIVLCNNDDDDGDKRLDDANNRVDTDKDLPDIAPLVVRKSPRGLAFPPGYRAFLRASNHTWFRIFAGRDGTATEIIGPAAGQHTYELLDLTQDEYTFGMEATYYAWERFDGHIEISIVVRDPSGSPCGWHQTRVRIAPWMMPNHLDETEKVYVMDLGTWNKRFRDDLGRVLPRGVNGVSLLQEPKGSTYGNDRWMQDVMEIGFSSFPRPDTMPDEKWHIPVVLRTPNDRGARYNPGGWTADDFPKEELLGPDFGFHEVVDPDVVHYSSRNSFGNLECSPPVKVNKRIYPFGRIVYGVDPDPYQTMHSLCRKFLAAQRMQSPFTIDTSWLYVGHVDEVISFCPMASQREIPRFRVLIASPQRAIDVLTRLQNQRHGSAPMLNVRNEIPGYQGIDAPSGDEYNQWKQKFDWEYFMKTPDQVLRNDVFLAEQRFVQQKIDAIQEVVRTQLGLSDQHFIKLPVLFWERRDPDTGAKGYYAYTPNVVNMLVVTKADKTAVLVIPKPFGPVVGTTCQFEQDIDAQLRPLLDAGNVRHYVDDFVNYHQGTGEIHCGTNSKRKPPTDSWWWWFDPG